MRYVDLRELLELAVGTLLGVGLVSLLHHQWPGLLVSPPTYDTWRIIGAGLGLLLAVVWSARKVDQRIDHRIPPHQRKLPAFNEGRPVGVLAWRTRDAASEYLWLVMGVVVVLMILWLVRTFVPR